MTRDRGRVAVGFSAHRCIAAFPALIRSRPGRGAGVFHCIDGGFGSVILSGPVVSFVTNPSVPGAGQQKAGQPG